jgi:hypothetical protein
MIAKSCALMAPAGVPDAIIEKLNKDLRAVLALPFRRTHARVDPPLKNYFLGLNLAHQFNVILDAVLRAALRRPRISDAFLAR